MDLNFTQQEVINGPENVELKILKRKSEDIPEYHKKLKTSELLKTNEGTKELAETKDKQNGQTSQESLTQFAETQAKVPTSPKKRLELPKSSIPLKASKDKFIYGNYSQYYGYRNKDKDYHDIRLDIFREHGNIFNNKCILDIGCNSGFITMEVAKRYEAKSIVGLDIDKSLINQAIKNLTKLKKSFPMDNELKRQHKFPFNTTFVHGNYVLKDDVLLEIETAQFDVILCLSVTKWIHLNFGDDGLKRAFKRMFLQLQPNGKLVLEAQPFDSYSRRKKISEAIFKNYKEIKLLPKGFTDYLLSSEVGFSKVELMGVPDHCTKGFTRPIHIFFKS